MKTLKIGDTGEEVITLQVLLKNHGYDLVLDGIFSVETEDQVEDFQKRSYLATDGIVGKMTWNALHNKVSDVSSRKINDTKYVLTTKNYYDTPQVKKGIVLHHTNGWVVRKGTEDKPSMSHFNWWKSTDIHVSTAYSIDYKGNIYQHFDPQHWAYHTGLGRKYNHIDKQTIGIELTNEGYIEKINDKFYWYSGKTPIPYNRINDEPVMIDWRGYRYYAPYSQDQIESTTWLVDYLCDKFNIEKNVIDDFDYHPELISDITFNGVFSHCNVRDYPSDKPKWDISPAFPIKKLKKEILK